MDKMLCRGKTLYDTPAMPKGSWIYGYYTYNMCETLKHKIHHEEGGWFHVDHRTVGRYTGRVSKDKTKIFEGDFIECIEKVCEGGGWSSERKVSGKVIFCDKWGIKINCKDCTQRTVDMWQKKNIKIMGCIHDKKLK